MAVAASDNATPAEHKSNAAALCAAAKLGSAPADESPRPAAANEV
jgi:hypothetical protein